MGDLAFLIGIMSACGPHVCHYQTDETFGARVERIIMCALPADRALNPILQDKNGFLFRRIKDVGSAERIDIYIINCDEAE